MIYSHEVEMMCPVAQGANHGPFPALHMALAGVLRSRGHVS